jgi:hypothetical protein
MKYFKKELWAGVNNEATYKKSYAQWERNLKKYVEQLEKLKSRLSKNASRFFAEESLHDATLIGFTVGDRVGRYPKDYSSFIKNRLRTTVLIEALTYSQDKIYTLKYTGIRKVSFDFPSSSPLFHDRGGPIDDWGYDELTAAGKEYLRHEILFSSGATILIEFKHFSYRRVNTGGEIPSITMSYEPDA